MRRIVTVLTMAVSFLLMATPALACGFLVSANGAVRLGRTTTFVTWNDGIEHYITNFTFSGPAESFGSIVPLPAEPIEVRKAGDWTLQRLQREVSPPPVEEVVFAAASADGARVDVLLRTRIDSLDVVVLKGGGADVLDWVNENGFNLPPGPSTEHLLEFYGSRSPYFLAARFDAVAAAQDEFIAGDGIPIQITVPTERPWVPLHILHGASPDSQVIEADIFLLTPERPDLLYGEGLSVERSEKANRLLLDDLRSDERMEWVPESGWLTYLSLNTAAENLVYDLSVGVGEAGPSYVDAGFTRFEPSPEQLDDLGLQPARSWWADVSVVLVVALIGGVVGAVTTRRRTVS